MGQQRDDGNHDQTHQHGQHTCVDGGAAEVAQNGVFKAYLEDGVQDELGEGDAKTRGKAGPDGGLGGLLPVQTVQEGSQEASGQSAPGDAHEVRDIDNNGPPELPGLIAASV